MNILKIKSSLLCAGEKQLLQKLNNFFTEYVQCLFKQVEDLYRGVAVLQMEETNVPCSLAATAREKANQPTKEELVEQCHKFKRYQEQ